MIALLLTTFLLVILSNFNVVAKQLEVSSSLNVLHWGLQTIEQKDLRIDGFSNRISRSCDNGTFKAYEPLLFESLRRHAGIFEDSFLISLHPNNLKCMNSDSKSGQYFWRSYDGTIILKTLKSYECRTLKYMLKDLYKHLTSEPSCIASILGLYRIKTKNGKKRYFLVMRNVFNSINNCELMFDLKGSTVGRIASNESKVLKDVNLITSGKKIQLGTCSRTQVLRALARDVSFLSNYGLMDYSLLVAVEGAAEAAVLNNEKQPNNALSRDGISKFPKKHRTSTRFPWPYWWKSEASKDSYTLRKLLETVLKGLIYDRSRISCVDPNLYGERFLEFMSTNFV
eukprot:gene8873-18372_t